MASDSGEELQPRLPLADPEPNGQPVSDSSSCLPSIRCTVGCELDTPIPEKEKASTYRHIVPKLHIPGYSELLLDDQRLTVYKICGKPYTMQAPIENETVVVYKRTTIGGRNLSYRLKVIQQPEKARACGNGPRSSADRRPVDPPPVVRLTIFDGDKDITQSYEAGFLLFADLEFARPIAWGRMHQNSHTYPVLTGVCVAGAAYLARPKNAAYFIFPDLSVRHEGWYRLRFHLFEQIKHRDDADPDRPFIDTHITSETGEALPPKAHENMANRTFVYSAPFQVFSAKKFPGLNTSTELSKIVADQGCRVRIRRDIRQRRTSKKAKDEDEQRSLHGTPVRSFSHDRTHSRDSMEHRPVAPELGRRLSIESPVIQGYVPNRQPSLDRSSLPSPNPAGMQYPAPRSSLPMSSPVAPAYNSSYHSQMAPPQPRSYTPNQHHSRAPLAPYHSYGPTTSPHEPPVSNLPGIDALLNLTRAPSVQRGGYLLPEPSPAKRQYRTYESEAALKDGARPVTEMPQPRKVDIASVLNTGGDLLEAENEGDDNSDSGDSLLDSGAFAYKRADGKISAIPSIRYHMSRM